MKQKPGYPCKLEIGSRIWLEENIAIHHCEHVYLPAEDSWQAVRLIKYACSRLRVHVCIDVGTGTGILAAACSLYCKKHYWNRSPKL